MKDCGKRRTIRDQIVDLAARPGGVSSAEIQEALSMRVDAIPITMQTLCYQGRVCRAKAPRQKLRWFANAHDRNAYVTAVYAAASAEAAAIAAEKQARREARTAAAQANRDRAVARAAKPGEQPQKTTAPAAQTAIVDGVPITRIPCRVLDARWQQQPDCGGAGFAAAGIGRYLALGNNELAG